MSSLLNLGSRALLANQIALSTTGHNIANASTVGYSRQTTVMQQVSGQYTGAGYIGKGVEVVGIERAHNEFLTRQATLAQSVQAMDVARADRLTSLEDIFQGGKSGLGAAVTDMINGFSDVASTPTDVTARNVVITRADELSARFRNAQTSLDDLQRGVNAQLGDSVKTINSLAAQIAQLNEKISLSNGGSQSPNDLLDQRDQLLRDLNQQVQTHTVAADDGSLNVFVSGQTLVLGKSATPVALIQAENGTSKLAMTRGALTAVLDDNMLGGGAVAGLLHFQNSDLAAARDGLGRMALAISIEVNAQHRMGIDLEGRPGGDFFKPIEIPDAMPANGNTGNAVVGAVVKDTTAMEPSSYQLKFTAAGVDVLRLSDGKLTSFTGPMPIDIDGLTLSVDSGAAAVGDGFLLRPYASAAGNMTTVLNSPRELAAASPIEARVAAANTGTVKIGSLAATAANANTQSTVTLTFTAAGTFDISGAGTGNPTGQSYAAGQPISFNGWQLTLTGTPKAGDTITIQAATPGYSNLNAGNAGALLALRDKVMFDGAPISDGYASLMAEVGVRAQSAQYAAGISSSIATSLETQRTSVSGVNLDEEAAKLLQYQQAYQASAKMIQIAQNVFDTLLQGMR
ncbi:Flagellar biosynthesis protein FlgK [Burkholderiales bacterium 8X]|nr:Flagellar biosynthesis protein FlgK [Burkholderiales bacterium 8X]